MKCNHCGEELGAGDSYDLMKSHMWHCESKVARAACKGIENEFNGIREDE
jgi:hypothetical protein